MKDEVRYYVTASTYEEPTYPVAQSGGVTWSDTYVCRGMDRLNEQLAQIIQKRGNDVRLEVCPIGPPLKLYTHTATVQPPPPPPAERRVVSADPVDFGRRVSALSPSL